MTIVLKMMVGGLRLYRFPWAEEVVPSKSDWRSCAWAFAFWKFPMSAAEWIIILHGGSRILEGLK